MFKCLFTKKLRILEHLTYHKSKSGWLTYNRSYPGRFTETVECLTCYSSQSGRFTRMVECLTCYTEKRICLISWVFDLHKSLNEFTWIVECLTYNKSQSGGLTRIVECLTYYTRVGVVDLPVSSSHLACTQLSQDAHWTILLSQSSSV